MILYSLLSLSLGDSKYSLDGVRLEILFELQGSIDLSYRLQ